MKKRWIALLVLVMLLAGCTNQQAVTTAATTAAQPENTAIVLTDLAGREVKLEKPAERVVALAAADCEILHAIGAGDTLVGRGEYCDYPEAVLAVPSVQSGYETNMEQVLALTPDLVILDAMYNNEEHVKTLENAGIAVLVNSASTLEQVYQAILMEATATGHLEEGQKVVADMQQHFQTISDKAATAMKDKAKKTVYFEVSPLEYGLWTAGADTFMDEIATILGVSNAFHDVPGWAEVSQEQIIQRDPDYMMTITMYSGEGPRPEEEIMGRTGWEKLKAVAEKQVFAIDSNSISRPGPRLADAAEELYNIIYGE